MLASSSLLSHQEAVTGLSVNKPGEPYGSHLLSVSGKNIHLLRKINPSQINIKHSAKFKKYFELQELVMRKAAWSCNQGE